jgi:hypothetical protein
MVSVSRFVTGKEERRQLHEEIRNLRKSLTHLSHHASLGFARP